MPGERVLWAGCGIILGRGTKKEEDDFDFSEKLHALNEELERLNAEAHELEEKIGLAKNVVTILGERPNE